MNPFRYPEGPSTRRHGPSGYLGYTSYLPWLRDEFMFRCCYCLRRERWEPDTSIFEIDHLFPSGKYPEMAREYTNLFYSCSTCNSAKGAEMVPDPSQALIATAISASTDGKLLPLTVAARRLVLQLDLNDPQFIQWRRMVIRIVELASIHDPVFHRFWMSYPDDLPDFSKLKPPGGNTRPEGIEQSYFQLRKNGELQEGY